MKILMIGGTGTISYDATQYFLNQGHEVYLLNRGNRNNLKHNNLHYIIGDANNPKLLQKVLFELKFDTIIDFIIFTKQQMQERMPVYSGKCTQFIFISSATVYSLTNDIISEESTEKNNVYWKYSHNKIECENYLKSHASELRINYTIVRPYITYDNRRIPFPVITKFSYYTLINRILNGKPVILCGNGDNKLTLTHTKDFAVALEGVIQNKQAMNEEFHITGDCVTTWNEIYEVICRALNVKNEVIHIPTNELANFFITESDELLFDKSMTHIFDNSKIKKIVPNFKTSRTVEEGITETIISLKENHRLQKIDSVWDDIIDVIIEKYEKSKGISTHVASMKAKIIYVIYQKMPGQLLKKVINKTIRMR